MKASKIVKRKVRKITKEEHKHLKGLGKNSPHPCEVNSA
jgi:hypothetical protein